MIRPRPVREGESLRWRDGVTTRFGGIHARDLGSRTTHERVAPDQGATRRAIGNDRRKGARR
ncbi:hypothetical protein GCM10023223_24830 [Stackebrandtia albiflava]